MFSLMMKINWCKD